MTRKTRTFWSVAWVAGAVASLAWKILNFEHGTFWNLTALAGVAIALVMVVLALVTQRREASPVSTASNAPRAPERRLAVSNVSRTCAEKESCPTVSSRRSETGSEFEAGSAVKIGGVVWHAHTARPEPDAAVGRLSSRQNRAMRSPAQSLQRESPCWSALPWRLIPPGDQRSCPAQGGLHYQGEHTREFSRHPRALPCFTGTSVGRGCRLDRVRGTWEVGIEFRLRRLRGSRSHSQSGRLCDYGPQDRLRCCAETGPLLVPSRGVFQRSSFGTSSVVGGYGS